MDYIIRLLVYSLAILIVSRLTKLIEIKNFGTALLFAFVLGIVNVLIKPIFLFISLPLIALTFGVFLIFVNGLMIIIGAAFFKNVKTKGCLSSAIASVLIAIIVFLFEMILFPGQIQITF